MEPENGDEIGNSFLQESYIVPDEMDCLELDTSDDSCTDGLKPCSPLREQDRFLPIANVAKIMKKAIPNNGKIAKDSRECVQECVSEFISFITSEASERCHTEKRKTINGEDILFAMTALGFENYVEPLKLYLNKYRETTKSDKTILTNDCVFEAITEDYKPTIETSTTSKTEPHGTTVLYLQNDQIQPFQL